MAKFRASRRLRFKDTKRIISPEIRPKSFGTFEKQARFSNDCRKTNNNVITPTNQNRSKQRDQPIRIPSNYL